MPYASGKHAWGISDRSGVRFRLRDMRKEWTGLLVGPDEYDPKHPQLFPPKAYPDPQALRNPRPDPEAGHVYVSVGNTVFPPVAVIYPLVGSVGIVTITDIVAPTITPPEALEALVGTVTVEIT